MRLLSVCLVLSALLHGPLVSAAEKRMSVPGLENVKVKTLNNGLKIVVWPDKDIPNVALYNWYKVGSRNEYAGITGISHFFEHMMFNGTSTRAPGEFDRIMEANGGANNAYTSSDVTVYQDWFPRSALETIFDLEGDRMANLSFDPKVIESERGVVFSERRSSIDNDNLGALIEQIDATAYIAHPYQIPTIGWPSDIEAWTIDDLKKYYTSYYAPNNAVMFVVGDVDAEEIFALAEKYIGKIPAQATPRKITTQEPKQLGERRLDFHRPAQSPLLVFAHHGLAGDDADMPALQLLMSILSEGDSSRLQRELVEQQQLAVDVGSQAGVGFDPSLVYLYAILPSGGNLAKTEAALDVLLARVVKEGVSQSELDKARRLKLAEFWRSMATISGKAQAMGSYEVFNGDYRKLFDAPANYDRVKLADIQRVAAKILQRENRTVGTIAQSDTK